MKDSGMDTSLGSFFHEESNSTFKFKSRSALIDIVNFLDSVSHSGTIKFDDPESFIIFNKCDKNSLISSKDIAMQYRIPKELMAKTLQLMAKIGYIKAIKGPHGGYKSNIKSKDISLKNFIESIEGPLGLIDCQINDDCAQFNSCNIKKPIKRINDNLLNFLDNISLVEITK